MVDEALALLDDLPPPVGNDRRALSLRASLLWNRAGAHVRAKSLAAAREPYQQSVAIFERLLDTADDAAAPNAGRNLSIVLKNYGALEWELGERTVALDAYRRAQALDEARLALRPDDTTWLLDLSYSMASVAFTERATGDLPASLDHYRRALTLRERALQGDPQNAQARDAVERARQTIAEVTAELAAARRP
jgi:tetratricopeptide (TPR) repeat protein